MSRKIFSHKNVKILTSEFCKKDKCFEKAAQPEI